jgi:hypothetical protein
MRDAADYPTSVTDKGVEMSVTKIATAATAASSVVAVAAKISAAPAARKVSLMAPTITIAVRSRALVAKTNKAAGSSQIIAARTISPLITKIVNSADKIVRR